MKKVFAFISILAVASAAFAEVTAKKLADGKVEATFFYGNPRATEVLLAGSFTDWQNGALAMEKGEKGFSLTKVFDAGTSIKYKFISDGNWTTDLKAPDFVDDGFGGKNSCADLDSIASGGEAAPKAGLKFQTWSMLGAQSKFDIKDYEKDGLKKDDAGLDSVGMNLKSYWKVSGEVLPNVPLYVEIALAEQDSFENIYKEGSYKKAYKNDGTKTTVKSDPALEWEDGLYHLGDILFDTVSYFNGGDANKTYLGHFKTGFNSKYVNWTTGYKYAKLPPHSINGWTTVDKEWDAGYNAVGGYNYFELGSALQALPFGTISAAVAPNKSADRAGERYGFFGWVNLNLGAPAAIDLQYNGAYGKEFKSMFSRTYEHDFIVGYKGIFGPLTFTANGLMNLYGEGDLEVKDNVVYKGKYTPSSSDVGAVDADEDGLTNMAGNVQVQYSSDMIFANAGFRFRGVQASMMYVKQADSDSHITDNLGDKNTWRAFADVNVNVTDALNIGVNPYVEGTLDSDKTCNFKDTDTLKIFAKPYFTMKLEDLNASINGYGEFYCYTKDTDTVRSVFGKEEQYTLECAGVKYDQKVNSDAIQGFNAIYCFDNRNADWLFNSVIGQVDMKNGYHFQAGFGIRTENADKEVEINNPFGFFLGASKQIKVLAKPTAYLQFLYAMDPYNSFGDGPTAYKLDGYKLDRGVTDFENSAAVRIGLQWDL